MNFITDLFSQNKIKKLLNLYNNNYYVIDKNNEKELFSTYFELINNMDIYSIQNYTEAELYDLISCDPN